MRRAEIRRILRSRQAVTVDELCALLNASPATIRRDLAALAENDELERSHGGAVVPLQREAELHFAQRAARDANEKRLLANFAVSRLAGASTVFLNDGSTIMALAEAIAVQETGIFVATSALNVAMALSECPQITACLLGGFVRQASLAVSGPMAEAAVAQINADIAILAPDGVHPERGVTFVNAQDAALARRMLEQSKRVIVLATRVKLMSAARFTGFSFHEISELVVGCAAGTVPTELCNQGVAVLAADAQPDTRNRRA